MPRIGVIGSFVWDIIYTRDRALPVEEWGGITYALSALDAALTDDWRIVPLSKVGHDLAANAARFFFGLRHAAADAPFGPVVGYPNNRVELRYYSDERRSEVLTGGLPGWTWGELKPVLDAARLDALYVNFLSGWELDLETMRLIRQHFHGPIYCDLHMFAWAVAENGLRSLRPISNVREWCGCVDFLQVNEDEMTMLAPDPMALAATALHAGVRNLIVTLGKRGVVYFAAPDFTRLADLEEPRAFAASVGPVRTSLVPPERVADAGDPTGCGDVWGATYFSRLLAGDNLDAAILAAHRAAARNVEHRGASGLADHLRGKISLT
ncbi:MAG: PfkB family carbohydrate kinase [Gemmatimonadales bacterium]